MVLQLARFVASNLQGPAPVGISGVVKQIRTSVNCYIHIDSINNAIAVFSKSLKFLFFGAVFSVVEAIFSSDPDPTL